MPYISNVNEQSYRIDIGEDAPLREIQLDGTPYHIDWRTIAPLAPDAKGQSGIGGRYSILIAGISYEVFVRRLPAPHTYEVMIAGQRFEVQVEDEREKMLAGAAHATQEQGDAIVSAPMPGLVVGIPHEVGASVTRGQGVIVLEAMKMENDLAAPRAGIIKEIRVSKGQTVNQGDVLVVIVGE